MSNPITLAVTDHVPMGEKERYEALIKELHKMFSASGGFLSVDIVRHHRPHQVEYTILSRWSDEIAVSNTLQDKPIREKISQIEAITGGPAQYVQAIGLGMWVDHTEMGPQRLPPAWKRITMSIIAVYPMLMLLMAITGPFIGWMPQYLYVLILVIVLSALLTWLIMPWLSKMLRPWLEPN
ncbi:MAG: hypothetical protein V7784_07265 [Oceanospirillaceae bacterium]